MTTTTGSALWTTTLDHRTGVTAAGGPASRYRRVARCDDRRQHRHDRTVGARPNFAARRLGALLLALSGVMAGTWLVGEVVDGLAAQPASAAAPQPDAHDASTVPASPDVHVARSGDTLWSIAATYRSNVSRDRYVDALVALNGGTSIHIGQAVRLP